MSFSQKGFAGGILVSIFCGEPILPHLLGDPTRLALATAVWYVLFYSPGDVVAKV